LLITPPLLARLTDIFSLHSKISYSASLHQPANGGVKINNSKKKGGGVMPPG